MRIFISVAAYRDPELIPTIADCLAKARHPERLRFGICWQHGDDEAALPFSGDPRFRIIDVPWRESRGVCWARARVMALYDDEEFFLQIDSHHRFVLNWDEKLLAQFARAPGAKPILTAYPASFVPGDPRSFGTEPMQIDFDRFTPEGIATFKPGAIADWPMRTRPVRARFAAAGFLFTTGGFVHEVPYDPELYFLGEEITLSIRAYTCGYDLFHPTEIILWHEYTRDYRPHKHWIDHLDGRVDVSWHTRDRASLEKVRRFLESPHTGPFGLGTARRFEDYEAYAGLSFRHRRAQDYTRACHEPPNPPAAPDWAAQTRRYEVAIAIPRSALPTNCAFWFVGFHDDQGHELYRLDAGPAEIAALMLSAGGGRDDREGGDGRDARYSTSDDREVSGLLTIRRSFESQAPPVKWIVWPHSPSGEWLERLEGDVDLRCTTAATPPEATAVAG